MKRTSRRPRRNPSPLDNPAFRRWFGASKVVDERGEPLVVWHGGFDAVRLAPHAFQAGVQGQLGPGIYLTPRRHTAEEYARAPGAAINALYARVERPLLVHFADKDPISDALLRATGKRYRFDTIERKYHTHYGSDVRSALLDAGFDGVFASTHVYGAMQEHRYFSGVERFVSEIVVFDPRQIKSATDNVGTYDPDDPSILRNPAAPTMPLYHATPQYNLDSILRRGLLRSKAGSVTLSGGGVFLTDERPLARGYAERRFGVDDYDAPWVLLKIDPRQLDPSLFEPDPGQEAELNAEDIEARGYTVSTMPWWVSLEETGQMVYAGDVPPSAIEPVEVMQPTNGDRWEPFAVQKNRRASRRPRRVSRRSR